MAETPHMHDIRNNAIMYMVSYELALTHRLGDNLLDMDRLNLGRLRHELSVDPRLPLPPSLQ